MSKRWDEVDDVDLLQMEAEMRGELDDLRTAATVYAERTWARGVNRVAERPALRQGWMAWTAAGLTAAVALAVGSARLLHRTDPPGIGSGTNTVAVRGTSPENDQALLEQIHSDLSSGVPSAMEPLEASTDAHSAQSAEVIKNAQGVVTQ